MDVFSLGCVIAEIYFDGQPLFDLARLQLYRKGQWDPEPELLKKMDHHMATLVLKMLDRDPKKRGSVLDNLTLWNEKIFPQSFSRIQF